MSRTLSARERQACQRRPRTRRASLCWRRVRSAGRCGRPKPPASTAGVSGRQCRPPWDERLPDPLEAFERLRPELELDAFEDLFAPPARVPPLPAAVAPLERELFAPLPDDERERPPSELFAFEDVALEDPASGDSEPPFLTVAS